MLNLKTTKMMHIKNLELKNFGGFSDFEIEFNDKVTHLIGLNGAGKTTVGLTAIWAGLKGIAEKDSGGTMIGDRYKFIGPNKASSNIGITLVDVEKNVEIKVNNHITKQGNQITFEAPENYTLSPDWLKELLSVAFISADHFVTLSPQEQALLLGIDTSKFDEKIKELKSEFTIINREIKLMGVKGECEKVEPVNVSSLVSERDKIHDFNQEQVDKQNKLDFAVSSLNEILSKEKSLMEELENIRKRIKQGETYINNLPKPEEKKDTMALKEKIANAEEINQKYLDYKSYLEWDKNRKEAEKRLSDNKAKQTKKEEERLKYIKEFEFGFKGLEVDDNGGLMLTGRPIKKPYFSRGELEIIVATLHASKDPTLKVRYIDDLEVLDDKNQEKIINALLSKGFQVITGSAHERDKKDNIIYLKECKIDKKEAPKEKLI